VASAEAQLTPAVLASRRREHRVLMLVENLSVPFDRRVWLEATALRDAGLDVVVVCPSGEDRDAEPFVVLDEIEIHRFRPRPSTGGAVGYLREYASAFRSMRRLVRDLSRAQRFDVVHAASPPDFLLLTARSLKRRGSGFVFDHHDLSPELFSTRFGDRRRLVHRTLLAVERLAFRVADVVIATNESYRRVALERGGKTPDDVFVVRNGPDLTRFSPRAPDPSLRADGRHVLCYVGMMGPQDGIDHALRAFAGLREVRDDWRAVLVGDGDVLPEMRALASSLGLDDVVEFTGLLEPSDVVRVLASADVCVSPEPSNPLNDASTMIKVGEYMAMARATVAFDLPETRATAGDAALLVTPGDEAGFANAIARLLEDADLRRELGLAARARTEQTLAWEHSVQHLYAAYERLLGVRLSNRAAASGRTEVAEATVA
jgi:glycosyltransferase involved in cell wall biosynthesis